jgi:bifunctional DNase/RNase
MKKIRLNVIGLQYSQTQTGAYALLLTEANGRRRLPIIIGGPEAQSIALELEKMTPSRPLTHDIFKTFAENFNIQLVEVVIYNLSEGVFFSKILFSDQEKEVEIDSRTSDAVALALRFGSPIFTYENILSSAGILIDPDSSDFGLMDEETDEDLEGNEFSKIADDELEKMLQEALEEEEYEKASRIRDELKNRSKN